MKYLLLLLIPCFCQAQKADSIALDKIIDSDFYLKGVNDLSGIGGTMWIIDTPQSKQDTVPVMMLVCDTASSFHGLISQPYYDENLVFHDTGWHEDKNRAVWWQYGYEVIPSYGKILFRTKPDGTVEFPKYQYLDSNKLPLPKSTVVWMTKQIK